MNSKFFVYFLLFLLLMVSSCFFYLQTLPELAPIKPYRVTVPAPRKQLPNSFSHI